MFLPALVMSFKALVFEVHVETFFLKEGGSCTGTN